jgi:formylglycine-generating enzyme required for sulfatase activity
MLYRLLLLFLVALGALLPALADEDRALRILKRFIEEFVVLTPGEGKFPASFVMGSEDGPASEKPPVKVTLKKPFALARYEVTQELYEVVTGKNPSRWQGPRNSVEVVSWDEANEFCRKVTTALHERKLIDGDEVIRLPSEAEWEYACRAGTTTRYSFGDDAGQLGDYGWFSGNARGNDPPVGRKKPNAWGLYDMHGYVWEWCSDAWQPTLEGSDGTPRQGRGAKERVLRGGSWADDADKARSAFRHHAPIQFRSEAVGFRCVRAKP